MQRPLGKDASGKSKRLHWSIIALCLLAAAGGSWALFEFVIWSRLPPELVGKWEVSEGKHVGAVFEFTRRGTMEAHINNPRTDMIDVIQASVALEGKTLLITTRNPNTKRDDTKSCFIKELTATKLVVEFDTGEVYKMVRMH